MLSQFSPLKKKLYNCYCKHASRTRWHCSVYPLCHGLKGRERGEWASSFPGKSERRRIHLFRGIPFCSSELSATSNPHFPRHSILFMETMANTAYKTLPGFSLPNPPAPSCMRRKAICVPFDISPKDLAKLFGSCLPTCRQFMSRLRGAITRMWIICVEKSE